jgi:hypothetical protein
VNKTFLLETANGTLGETKHGGVGGGHHAISLHYDFRTRAHPSLWCKVFGAPSMSGPPPWTEVALQGVRLVVRVAGAKATPALHSGTGRSSAVILLSLPQSLTLGHVADFFLPSFLGYSLFFFLLSFLKYSLPFLVPPHC